MAESISTQNQAEEVNIDRILENMFMIMLFIHKKLLKTEMVNCNENLTRLHFAVMGELGRSSTTMSELAKTLMMTKPQMTHLVESLVQLDLVQRTPDTKDRRVINLALTEKGHVMGKEMKRQIKENTKNRLAGLTGAELGEMATALETLRSTIGKL
jgi:DNA-binding MarR family transcriptional regulator